MKHLFEVSAQKRARRKGGVGEFRRRPRSFFSPMPTASAMTQPLAGAWRLQLALKANFSWLSNEQEGTKAWTTFEHPAYDNRPGRGHIQEK